jgi:Flp pilus assembly protein TadD
VALVTAAGLVAVQLAAGLYGAEAPATRVVVAARKLLAPQAAAFRLPSARTLGDVWSQFVIVGPLSLPLVAAIFALLRGPRFRNRRSGAFLGLAALTFSMPVFLVGGWGIGPARDWDIFAAPAVAVALCGVVLVAEGAGALRRPLLVALAAASLFHTAPWIALNTSRERTMIRVAELPLGKGRSPMMLGTHFLNAGELDQAERWYRASLAADSLNVNSQSGLGLALARQGRYAEALPPMEAAVRWSPTKREFRRDLIALLFALERWSDAARQLEALLWLDPADPRAWLGLSDCYLRLGRPDSAALALEVAVTRVPRDPQVHAALAAAYEAWVVERGRAGDRQGVRDAFARLEARYPADPRTLRLRPGVPAGPDGGR